MMWCLRLPILPDENRLPAKGFVVIKLMKNPLHGGFFVERGRRWSHAPSRFRTNLHLIGG